MGWAQTARDEIGLLAIFSGLEFCMRPFHARFSDSIGKRSRFWYPMCTYLFHESRCKNQIAWAFQNQLRCHAWLEKCPPQKSGFMSYVLD